jgi:anti-sigma regulatory factor (Ser/Thr protein kinase)
VTPIGPSGFSVELPWSLETPGDARRCLAERLAAGGVDVESDGAQAALLMISEMATNAVVHAAEPIRVEANLVAGGLLHLAVSDGLSDELPAPHRPDPGAAGGWGMVLVGRLSDSWGIRARTDGFPGKEVWAEVRLATAGRRFADPSEALADRPPA